MESGVSSRTSLYIQEVKQNKRSLIGGVSYSR